MVDLNPPSEGGSYILDPDTGIRTLVQRGGSEPKVAAIAEPVAARAPAPSSAAEPDQTDPTDPTTIDAPVPTKSRKGA